VRFERVSLLNWAMGTHLTNGFYAQFSEVEWGRNATGLTLTSCYNVNLYGPRFACLREDGVTRGVAISAGSPRGLNIYGGSIEGYGAQGIILGNSSHLGLYGVYFETGVDANAGAVWADARANVSIIAEGCFTYLNGHTRWITTAGSTSTTLVGRGNHFVCVDASTTTPTAYIVTPGQDVDLAGDNWAEVAKAGVAYAGVSSGSLFGQGLRIAWPKGSSTTLGGATTDGRPTLRNVEPQTLAAAGAVTIDAAKGDAKVTLNANATSSSISNPVNWQEITITWVQDATGGRTYAWPTNVRFAGGVAPSDTTANTRTSVRLKYESFTARWHELTRAVAVPNS
jgi:hypothetical protein